MVRIHMSIGQRLPLLIGALGRCMAVHAGLAEEERARRYALLRSDALPPFATFLRQVAQARRQGYAVDADHFVSGITTVSAAVRDGAGQPVMTISAVDLSARLGRAATRRLGAAIAAAADDVGRALGARPAAILPAAWRGWTSPSPPEQEALRATVRRFAESELAPLAREADDTEISPRHLFRRFGELGLIGVR